MSFTISIGGIDNYEVASFETTNSNHGLQVTTDDPDGKITFKLGTTAGSESCFKILDSDGNPIVEKAANKKVTNTGSMNIHGTLHPSKHEFLRFSSMSFGNEKDEGSIRDGRVLYVLLNLIDLCGYNGVCKFNKFKWYISECTDRDFCTIQVAIYKLDSNTTFGNLTTYDDSTLVTISNKVHWNDELGETGNGIGFMTFNFANTVEISQSTDGVENRYFLAILATSPSPSGSTIYKIYSTNSTGTPSREKDNYFYISTSATQLEYNMINARINNNALCPYFSVFYKKYTKNSWILENNYKYFIDAQGRKYRLLLRQDIEKDLQGNAQSAAGWPNSSTILSDNKYWSGYTSYPDPETSVQFLDMRGDETGTSHGFQFEEFRDYEGLLEMKMEWPGIVAQGYDYTWTNSRSYPFNFESSTGEVTNWMTWKQTVDPLTTGITSRTGSGYEAISEGINLPIQNGTHTDLQFVGTTKHTTTNAYNDGNANGSTKWWLSCGVFNIHAGGIPIFTTGSALTNKIIGTKVNLWLRCPAPRDVYLLLGQSNCVGRGTVSELTSSYADARANCKFFNAITPDTAWSAMTPGDTSDNATDFGPEISFGANAAACHIFKYADGGTDLANDWAARTGPEYTTTLSRLKDALNTDMGKSYRVRAVLWLQGEADASVEAEANAYETNLTNFIKCLREDLNIPYLPFIIGKIYAPQKTYRDIVRAAQQAVADVDPYTGIFETADLTLYDNLHYNTASQLTIGDRYWSTLQDIPSENYQEYS